MGKETERKFLVDEETDFRQFSEPVYYCQGYLCTDEDRVVRVRLAGEKGFLTVKGRNRGAVRSEYEYEIPPAEACEMLEQLCLRPLIAKYRYRIPYDGLIWEVDVFTGENEGLTVAEVELPSEDYAVSLPSWVRKEVTDDWRYYNSALVKCPYNRWE